MTDAHPLSPTHDFPRARSVHRPIDPVTFVLQSGGRWERLLAPLCEGVLTQSELMQATNPGIHTRKVERCRIRRALDTMRGLGLVESIPGFGWTATARGRDQLDSLQATSGREIPDGSDSPWPTAHARPFHPTGDAAHV